MSTSHDDAASASPFAASTPPAPPQPPPKKPRGLFMKLCLAYVLIHTTVTVAWSFYSGYREAGLRAAVANWTPQEADWRRATLVDVVFDSPVPLLPTAVPLEGVEPEVAKVVASIEARDSGAARNNFRVLVQRIQYAPGVDVPLEVLANSFMAETARALGDAQSQEFETTPKKVSTRDGLSSHHVVPKNRVRLHVDMLLVKERETIWMAKVLSAGEGLRHDVERVLDSVEIQSKR